MWWKGLSTIAPDDLDELLTYFANTFINGIYRARENANNIRVRQICPRFPPDTWNVHERTLSNEPCTNNFCEGWNSRFTSMVSYNHPSIWKAIKSIQVEANEVSTKLLQTSIVNPPKKNTKSIYLTTRKIETTMF